MKNLQRKVREKRGSNTIEYAISLLIFVLLFGFFVDITMITWKFIATSQIANSAIKTLSVQSGVTTNTPNGFPGANGYINSAKLYNNISTSLKDKAGIEKFTVKLKGYDKNGGNISNKTLSPSTNFQVDYRGRIQIEINIKYEWTISKILPGLSNEKSITAIRSGITEYKYDYDKWIGE